MTASTRTQFGLLAIIVAILCGIGVAAQRSRPLQWRMQRLENADMVSIMLNSMPIEQAREAKVVCDVQCLVYYRD